MNRWLMRVFLALALLGLLNTLALIGVIAVQDVKEGGNWSLADSLAFANIVTIGSGLLFSMYRLIVRHEDEVRRIHRNKDTLRWLWDGSGAPESPRRVPDARERREGPPEATGGR